ncbi:MAG TPA: hypothetical protein PLX20_04405 [Rhodocyclaceae bacterium]|nr:hypothetical protein [Rhodocyclaceae bacterium]HMV55093.1 hypothetical protein [Rhodocyclaceae bacterium]HNA04775.1 hypothetical protein [Rhodocyclaceae bacterium]HNH12349.1 hypothetical protein [Rhodocyclaceae bacterium]
MRRLVLLVPLLAAVAMVAGCATLESPQREHLVSADSQVRDCAAWFAALDRAVDTHGVRDGSAHRIAGYPYLRADRFTAAFRNDGLAGTRLRDWVARLHALDASARSYETANLPDAALASLNVGRRDVAQTRTQSCAGTLMQRDFAAPDARAQLVARASVPDDYHTWQRVVGVYALTRIPFLAGVSRWQAEAEPAFRTPPPAHARIVRYAPAEPPNDASAMRGMLARIGRDALGIAQPDEAQLQQLLAAYAPVFEIEHTGDDDLPGALYWPAIDAPAPAVDTAQPTVYARLAHTHWGGRPRLQMVYSIWFPARPRTGAFDLLGGRLDGVVWRVTLDDDGTPLVYDTIHPCGCYQMFFPANGVVARPPPETDIEWAFVPTSLPPHGAGHRVRVRIEGGTHYVHHVSLLDSGQPDGAPTRYAFAADDALRALPLPGGGSRSAFRPDGLIAGSERGERFLFWPMGIASAGAMRQWGRHATAFVGRRHFDDADLLERRFVLPER